MPEGPEVYKLIRWLYSLVKGKYITEIISNTKSTVELPSRGKIKGYGSKGKLMWLRTNKYYLHIHLGISGWLVLEEPKIYKYHFKFGNLDVYLKDRRRFSSLKITDEEGHQELVDNLGPSILTKEFTLGYFSNLIKSKALNISALLLNQQLLSGVGNYIRNDALYIARISPKRKSNNITDREIKKLYKAIKFVAKENAKINNDYEYKVYDREYDPKRNKITTEKVAGRNTYWVESLQK